MVSVPGLSLPYQLRISRTRSVIGRCLREPSGLAQRIGGRLDDLGCRRSSRSRPRRSPAGHSRARSSSQRAVAEAVELGFGTQRSSAGSISASQCDAAPALPPSASRVDVRQHVAPARRAAADREVRPRGRPIMPAPVATRPSAASSRACARGGSPASRAGRSPGSEERGAVSRARRPARGRGPRRAAPSSSGRLQSRQRPRGAPPPSGTARGHLRGAARGSGRCVMKRCGGRFGSRTRRVSRVSSSRPSRRAQRDAASAGGGAARTRRRDRGPGASARADRASQSTANRGRRPIGRAV